MCVWGRGEERKMKVRWWWKRERIYSNQVRSILLARSHPNWTRFRIVQCRKPFLLWGGSKKERKKERKTESKGKGLLTSILENGSKGVGVGSCSLPLSSQLKPTEKAGSNDLNWMRGRKGGRKVCRLGGWWWGSWGSWGRKERRSLCGEIFLSISF